jgi:hypothetical protein
VEHLEGNEFLTTGLSETDLQKPNQARCQAVEFGLEPLASRPVVCAPDWSKKARSSHSPCCPLFFPFLFFRSEACVSFSSLSCVFLVIIFYGFCLSPDE